MIILTACGSRTSLPEVFDQTGTVIEISDLYQAGQLQFKKSIETQPDLEHSWQSNRSQVLLISMTVAYDDGDFERVQQSGVFVASGRYVLTAGHGFYIDDGHITEVWAQTISGYKLRLELVSLLYDKEGGGQVEDWAILKPTIRFNAKGINSALPKSYSRDVVVLGFPGSMGLDNTDQVVHIHEVERGAIFPLGLICERLFMNRWVLRPQAGAIPIRGMSGAPVLDPQGKLVGLFSSVSRTRSISGWHYILGMSNIPVKSLDSLMKK